MSEDYTKTTLKDHARAKWAPKKSDHIPNELLIFGCLQRIADAFETYNARKFNYNASAELMKRSRDSYKKKYLNLKKKMEQEKT